MKLSKSFFHFNKEILSGELGAFLGAQTAGLIIHDFEFSKNLTSALVVAGAVVGSTVFYLPMRLFHQKKRKNFSVSGFSKGVALYSVAAVSLTFLVYYPTLFFGQKLFSHFVNNINLAILLAQTLAFGSFLLFINIYRLILKIYFKKEL